MERSMRTLVLLAVTMSLTASAAHAGLGGLVKSAKDKATQTVTGTKSTGDSGLQPRKVEFDETMVELTGPLLDKLVAARTKANAGLKDRPALVKRQAEIKTEIDDLGGKYTGAITENENKRGEQKNCMDMALDAARKKNWEAKYREMQANPASAQKLLELTAAVNDAQMKGDTVTANRLTREADKVFAPTRADSLEAQKKCGPAPPPHPAAVKIDQLNAELGQVDAKLRDMDAKAMKLQSDECGLPEATVAMAWERIEMFCRGGGAFSEKELPALNERKASLCAALKG